MATGRLRRITSRGTELSAYELEPQLVTALFDAEQRSKRQVVKYNEIPPVMVQAVLAIEDRRFFEHSGVNFGRTLEAVWEDVIRQRRAQGGSTLTQQLARGFFLTPEKSIKRKVTEMLIAEELEQKFSKQQIFEFYANWVNLGQRGSFGISGFAEASPIVFREGSERHLAAGSGIAGGNHPGAEPAFAVPASGARARAAQSGAGRDGRNARDHQRSRRTRRRRPL